RAVFAATAAPRSTFIAARPSPAPTAASDVPYAPSVAQPSDGSHSSLPLPISHEVSAAASGESTKHAPAPTSDGWDPLNDTLPPLATVTRESESSADPPALTSVNAASAAAYSATPRSGSPRGCARATVT